MGKSNTTIVIIDDDMTHESAPLDDLKIEFNEVVSFQTIERARDYLDKNIDKKKIVILDYQLGSNHLDGGLEVLKEIRKTSSLTPVVLYTSGKMNKDKYPELIQNELNYYVEKGKGDIIKTVKLLDSKLNNNVAAALEEWILVQNKEKREKPYMISANGCKYSLDDILKEVRKESPVGKEFVKDLNSLTIHLLLNGKEKLK